MCQLHTLVDAFDQGRASQNAVAKIDQIAPDQICGQKTKHRQANDPDHKPESWNAKGKIGLRQVSIGDKGRHPAIDQIDKPPGNGGRDGEWPGDNQPGQKITAKPRHGRCVRFDHNIRNGTRIRHRGRCAHGSGSPSVVASGFAGLHA
jgi:hypothetical protein